jgi:hypothetical protein
LGNGVDVAQKIDLLYSTNMDISILVLSVDGTVEEVLDG